jgi:hypothetical protein
MSEKRADLVFLIATAIITVLLCWFVPFGRFIIYPFSLLGIWFHEMGHGLTAILLGGTFEKLEVNLTLSGVATHSSLPGIRNGLVALGGLLGPSIAGSVLILLGRSRSLVAPALYALGAAMIASMLILGKSSLGMWCIAAFGAGIILFTAKTGDILQRILLHFLGAQAAVSVFTQIDYLFMRSANIGGRVMHSDVSVVAQELFLPVPFWSYGLTVVTVGMLVLAIKAAYGPEAPTRPVETS